MLGQLRGMNAHTRCTQQNFRCCFSAGISRYFCIFLKFRDKKKLGSTALSQKIAIFYKISCLLPSVPWFTVIQSLDLLDVVVNTSQHITATVFWKETKSVLYLLFRPHFLVLESSNILAMSVNSVQFVNNFLKHMWIHSAAFL
jgi:hypothetical protein